MCTRRSPRIYPVPQRGGLGVFIQFFSEIDISGFGHFFLSIFPCFARARGFLDSHGTLVAQIPQPYMKI